MFLNFNEFINESEELSKKVRQAADKMNFSGIDLEDYFKIAKASKNAKDYAKRIISYHKKNDEIIDVNDKDTIKFAELVFGK